MMVNHPNTRKDPPPKTIPSKFLFFKAVNVPYPARIDTKAKMITRPTMLAPLY